MLYFVYELVDPRTNQPFYVGITKDPNYRMWQHLTAKDNNKRKKAKIVDIQSEGLSPRMRIIETTENERTVLKKETYWIHKYIEQGIVLTNILQSKPSMLSESWPSLLTSIDPSLAHLECFDLDMYIVVASPSLSSIYK